MAAVEVTITGKLYDLLNRTEQRVVLIGEGSLTGVGIGGGPIIPPDNIKPPIDPDAHPEHPIVIPPDRPTEPPPDGANKPPPPSGGWGYVNQIGYGWAYYPGPGEARPK